MPFPVTNNGRDVWLETIDKIIFALHIRFCHSDTVNRCKYDRYWSRGHRSFGIFLVAFQCKVMNRTIATTFIIHKDNFAPKCCSLPQIPCSLGLGSVGRLNIWDNDNTDSCCYWYVLYSLLCIWYQYTNRIIRDASRLHFQKSITYEYIIVCQQQSICRQFPVHIIPYP